MKIRDQNTLKRNLTVSLHGGIGNQLFQYAFARAYSLQYGMRIKFDLYGFAFDKKFKRNFSLDQFNIPKNIERVNSFFLFQLARVVRHLGTFGEAIVHFFGLPLLLEGSTKHRLQNINTAALKEFYAFGYWQDEKYFFHHEDQIRKDLGFSTPLSEINLKIAKDIQSSPVSVSVHVRRLHQVGADDPQKPVAEIHGETLSVDYYRRALKIIGEKFSDVDFFIFSDYPDWAKKNLAIPSKVQYLKSGRGSDIEDLYLMSLCDHHIIANSSFSWWGAWLATSYNQGQIVVAPEGAPLTPKIPDKWIAIAR
jgi:Glycosyl transferase family 11